MVPVIILCFLRSPHARHFPFSSKLANRVLCLPLMSIGLLLTFARDGFDALACFDFLEAITVGVHGSLGAELSVEMSRFCPDFGSWGEGEGLCEGLLVEG